jgi:hypothetical protein
VADLLASGAAWLTEQLKAAAGTTVTYTRSSESADVVATIGRSEFEAASQSGVVERWESRDFLITAADLPFGLPQRGDEIVEARGGEIVTYEVTSPRGVPEWHYGDAFRSIVRVHTIATDQGVIYLTTENNEQLTTEAGELLVI